MKKTFFMWPRYLLLLIEDRLKEGKDTTIDGFGTFLAATDQDGGKSVMFTPSDDLLEKLDGGSECPHCNSRNVLCLNPRLDKYICRECETIWEG